jgi:hypothetical protein
VITPMHNINFMLHKVYDNDNRVIEIRMQLIIKKIIYYKNGERLQCDIQILWKKMIVDIRIENIL